MATKTDCIPLLKVLADETRWRITRELLRETLSVNDITNRLGLSQYNVSKHLRVMKQAGLLESTKDGKLRLYSVARRLRSRIQPGKGVLDLGCCSFQLDKSPS